MSTDYVTAYHWEAAGLFLAMQEERLRFAKKYIQPSDTVLDVGCGDGFMTWHISNMCSRAIGLDSSNSGVKLAGERLKSTVPVILSAADSLPFPSNMFDAVLFFEVIEHMMTDKAREALVEAWRVLKPFGFVIVTTPNVQNLDNRIRRRRLTSEKHVVEYDISHLLKLLDMFTTVETKGLYLPIPLLSLTSKSRYRFLWWVTLPLGRILPGLAKFIMYCGRKC